MATCTQSYTILLTDIIPFALVACLMDSTVCCFTPSSAPTTSTTMSVTLAPLALIVSNAAWPGVSMNVIVLSVPLMLTAKGRQQGFQSVLQ